MSTHKFPQEHITKNKRGGGETILNRGDLCWFKVEQKAHIVGDGPWKEYLRNCFRVIYPNDPIIFIKRFQDKKHPGKFIHYIECLGLRYVLIGPSAPLTLSTPYERGITAGR